MNILALVMNIQGLAIIALAFTDVAGHIDIGQKVHLDFGNTIALAGFAAAALNIKAKAPGVVTP